MEEVKCDCCGSSDYKIRYRINVNERNMRFYRYARNIPQKESMTGIFTIVDCSNCHLSYTNPRFTTEELALVYSSERIIGGNWKHFWYLFDSTKPDRFEGGIRKANNDISLYNWKFDIIRQYQNKPSSEVKLLDIGCGNGKFVNDAIKKGYSAIGIDLSPDRIKSGREIYDLDEKQLRCMNVDEFSSDEKFDVVVMWDLIEHVESPARLLENIRKIIHKDSVVLALTMSFDSITYKIYGKNWYYINPTQHLHYFSNKTIRNLFQTKGYELVAIEMDDSRNKNFLYLFVLMMLGRVNQFFFWIYSRNNPLKWIFRILQRGISDERMKVRIENLYPGIYVGRYHDNFVFVAKVKP